MLQYVEAARRNVIDAGAKRFNEAAGFSRRLADSTQRACVTRPFPCPGPNRRYPSVIGRNAANARQARARLGEASAARRTDQWWWVNRSRQPL